MSHVDIQVFGDLEHQEAAPKPWASTRSCNSSNDGRDDATIRSRGMEGFVN